MSEIIFLQLNFSFWSSIAYLLCISQYSKTYSYRSSNNDGFDKKGISRLIIYTKNLLPSVSHVSWQSATTEERTSTLFTEHRALKSSIRFRIVLRSSACSVFLMLALLLGRPLLFRRTSQKRTERHSFTSLLSELPLTLLNNFLRAVKTRSTSRTKLLSLSVRIVVSIGRDSRIELDVATAFSRTVVLLSERKGIACDSTSPFVRKEPLRYKVNKQN